MKELRETPVGAADMTGTTTSLAWRKIALRVGAAFVVPVLALVLLEIGLRIVNIGYPTSLLVPCTIHGQPASCYNLFFPAPFFPPGMIKTPESYSIPAVKQKRTYRIFVLGESAAMGDPDPAYSFSRYLDVMLSERYPSLKFEVVNTGSVAINSHVLLPMAQDLAKVQPDLFIIYSGNNEVVGPYGPGTVLSSTAMSLPIVRASIYFRSTRIGQLVTKLGAQKQEWRGMEMFLDKQVPASSPLMSSAYSNFKQNLKETIAAGRNAGARVIVATVATNLKDCAPFGSMHRDGMSSEQLRSWTALVDDGKQYESANDFSTALARYTAASKIDDQYAELEFRIARSLWKLGNYVEAEQHYSRARDLDTLRFRADSRINEINRSVASSFAGAELVDAAKIFRTESPDGVTGNELVYEHVHLTPLGNYLLAKAMFLQIASKMPAPDGHIYQAQDVPSEDDCERRLAFTDFDRARIAGEMLQRLQNPPFTNQINHNEQVLKLMFEAAPTTETPQQTATAYQWAIAQRPNDRILHYNFGQFLFQYNRMASVQQFKLAQPWDGFPVFLPDGTPIN
jgi:tetratricopeptide (TPR) repeat protein